MIGPSATAMPEKPAQMAMARPRSRGSRKTLMRIESVDGMISAPPTPINARVKMRCCGEPARAESTEPAAKMTMPMRSARLRPRRSPKLPAVRRRPANTRV